MTQQAETIGDFQQLVNYEGAPIVVLELDGVSYRLDTDQGSSVAVSCCGEGRSDWKVVSEGRWDGRRLKAKGLSFEVTTALAEALKAAMSDREEQGWA